MIYFQQKKGPLLRRRSNLVKLLQALLDGVGVLFILRELLVWRFGEISSTDRIMSLVLVVSMAIGYEYLGIYRHNANVIDKTIALFRAWTFSFLCMLAAIFLTHKGEDYPRDLLFEAWLLGFLAQLVFHALFKFIHHRLARISPQTNQVLIVGQGALASYLQRKISSNLWMGEKVVGMVSVPDSPLLPGEGDPVVLGDVSHLPELVDRYKIDVVYIVTPLTQSGVLGDIYPILLDKHVTIHWIPDIFALRLVNHGVTELAGIPVLTLSETPLIGLNRAGKLIEDRMLAGLILLMISPVLLLVALLVKLDSPGPVFYRQNRAGWNGKIFRIWKFRSMYVHQEPESGSIKQAEKNDSRITRVGRFIRKTSLDELPQIFNVLTGDMSLVGPRPHAIQHDSEYSKRISDYFARHQIKPGITGLAQVRGLRGETKDIQLMIQRIESDIEYINHWSVWLDLWIILRTLKAFSGKTAY